jgi:hypothetical protein
MPDVAAAPQSVASVMQAMQAMQAMPPPPHGAVMGHPDVAAAAPQSVASVMQAMQVMQAMPPMPPPPHGAVMGDDGFDVTGMSAAAVAEALTAQALMYAAQTMSVQQQPPPPRRRRRRSDMGVPTLLMGPGLVHGPMDELPPASGARKKKPKTDYTVRFRPRVPFSPEEEESLLQGYERFRESPHKWADILESYAFHPSRTSVDLKDKYRNMFCKQQLPEKRTFRLLGTAKTLTNRCVALGPHPLPAVPS